MTKEMEELKLKWRQNNANNNQKLVQLSDKWASNEYQVLAHRQRREESVYRL